MKEMRPIQVFGFMMACLGALALMCLVMPKQLHTPDLRQILGIGADSVVVQDTLEMADTANVEANKPIEEMLDTIDTRVYMSDFYASLKTAAEKPIRVVHYGDSQIEEDRLSAQLRRALQKRYGGGGVGIIPLHQTIPTRTISQHIRMNGQIQNINQGPKRYLVYGPKTMRRENSVYGVMGQVAYLDNEEAEGSEEVVMEINGTSNYAHTERYFNRIRIIQSGTISVTTEQAIDSQDDVFIMPDSSYYATIHFKGKGDIYGISLEQDHGVMVDNIPMRGCSGDIFTNIATDDLRKYFATTNTRLILLQYGGNVIPFTTNRQQVKQYVEQMRTQIRYLKQVSPESSIMFVGPSDMSEIRDGELQTYQMIPVMDRALQRMAIEEQIGYFSLYQHMGGNGSMIQWKEKGLAGGDYVHFTRKGAEKAGKMLAEWLLQSSKL